MYFSRFICYIVISCNYYCQHHQTQTSTIASNRSEDLVASSCWVSGFEQCSTQSLSGKVGIASFRRPYNTNAIENVSSPCQRQNGERTAMALRDLCQGQQMVSGRVPMVQTALDSCSGLHVQCTGAQTRTKKCPEEGSSCPKDRYYMELGVANRTHHPEEETQSQCLQKKKRTGQEGSCRAADPARTISFPAYRARKTRIGSCVALFACIQQLWCDPAQGTLGTGTQIFSGHSERIGREWIDAGFAETFSRSIHGSTGNSRGNGENQCQTKFQERCHSQQSEGADAPGNRKLGSSSRRYSEAHGSKRSPSQEMDRTSGRKHSSLEEAPRLISETAEHLQQADSSGQRQNRCVKGDHRHIECTGWHGCCSSNYDGYSRSWRRRIQTRSSTRILASNPERVCTGVHIGRTYRGRRIRSRRNRRSTQEESSIEGSRRDRCSKCIVNKGSVAGCLRNTSRVPNKKVRWCDAEAYDDDEGCEPSTHCAASIAHPIPIHSIQADETCVFPFAAVVDANWLAATCILEEHDDIQQSWIQKFSQWNDCFENYADSISNQRCMSLDMTCTTFQIAQMYQQIFAILRMLIDCTFSPANQSCCSSPFCESDDPNQVISFSHQDTPIARSAHLDSEEDDTVMLSALHFGNPFPNMDNDNQPPPRDEPDQNNVPDEHVLQRDEAPEYMVNLQVDMWRFRRRAGATEGEPFVLRVWFIHHGTLQKNTRSKIVRVRSRNFVPWQRWHEYLTHLWPGQLQPSDPTLFSAVHPTPPGALSAERIDRDLIISQGLEHDRNAVIYTIQTEADRFSTGAFSVLPTMSGNDFRRITETEHLCLPEHCVLKYCRTVIPLNDDRTFQTEDGQALFAAVGNDQDETSIQQQSQDDLPSLTSQSVQTDAHADSTHMQQIVVYNLRLPWQRMWATWSSYSQLAHDVALRFALPVGNIQALHEVRVWLPGENEFESSLILQHVGDIPLGSLEVLLVLDVEIHRPHDGGRIPPAPQIERFIVRTNNQIARDHVIVLARARAYCALQQNRCLVFHNHDIWRSQDLAARHVLHGEFLKVIVPPPSDDACTGTITEVRQHFNEALVANAEHSHDQTTFLQTSETIKQHNSLAADAVVQIKSTGEVPETCFPTVDIEDAPLPARDPDVQMPALPSLARQLSPFWFGGTLTVNEQQQIRLQVRTWFIDHVAHVTCPLARDVILPFDHNHWESTILQTWTDRYLPNFPVDFFVVDPVPQDDIWQPSFLPHIIVQQRAIPLWKSAIVTVYDPQQPDAGIQQKAQMVRASADKLHVLHVTGMYSRCQPDLDPDRCMVFVGDMELRIGRIIRVSDATCFHLHMTDVLIDPAHDSLIAIETDDVQLMQRVGSNVPNPEVPSTEVATDQTDNDQPGNLEAQPFFIQFLYTHWTARARCQMYDQTRMASIVTWFLDGATQHRCEHPRVINLFRIFTIGIHKFCVRGMIKLFQVLTLKCIRFFPQCLTCNIQFVLTLFLCKGHWIDALPRLSACMTP